MKYTDFAGVIFDVDDTLLDNHHEDRRLGLHARSRLAAAREVGRRHGITRLAQLTPDENVDAWERSKIHMLEGGVWEILRIAGVVDGETINFDNSLLKEIAVLKEELHEDILRTEGREVPGASQFIRKLAQNGLSGKMAIASTANPRDIHIFLELVGLQDLFPHDRIVSKAQLTHPKPNPQAFDLAFKSLGMPESARKQVVAFEDDPRGVASAKTAGLFVCAITTTCNKKQLAELEAPPDIIADSYAAFETLFGLADV